MKAHGDPMASVIYQGTWSYEGGYPTAPEEGVKGSVAVNDGGVSFRSATRVLFEIASGSIVAGRMTGDGSGISVEVDEGGSLCIGLGNDSPAEQESLLRAINRLIVRARGEAGLGMTPEELRAFLDRKLNGVVSTVYGDASPHGVPVWYRFDGQSIHIWTGGERAWVRGVKRSGLAALTVHDSTDPLSAAVIIHGRASVRTANWEKTEPEARQISERYLPAEELDEFINSWTSLTTIVTIEPVTIRSWRHLS